MKNVTLTVRINARIPDDVDEETLFLHMEPSDFTLGGGANDEPLLDADITGFETVTVELDES